MEDKRNLLEDQIEAHLKKMQTLNHGSEEMGKATRELDTLYKLAQEADADNRKALAEDEEVVRNERRFEFEQEKSPVIVCDWTGDFKKGEFTLDPTWVSKKKGMNLGKLLLASIATIATGGVGAVLFANYDETHYKKEIVFNGANDNWGKMSYMKSKDLSQFKND